MEAMTYVGSAINLRLIIGLAQSFLVVSQPTNMTRMIKPKTIKQMVRADFHGHVPTVPVRVRGTSNIIKPAVRSSNPIKSSSTALAHRDCIQVRSAFALGGYRLSFFARVWAT